MEKKIEIVFEDEDLIVVNKPAGLVTTKEKKQEENTLEDWLRERLSIVDRRSSIQLEREGIVHRLDKGTSGLILVAKNEDALKNLKKQFKDRTIGKKYLTMVCGNATFKGEINVPINRSKFGFGKFGVDTEGKKAWTIFKLLDKYKKNNRIYSLLEIDLKTGRTHQIRVHLSYLGWPLLGDKLYGGEIDDLQRPFLHSYEIRFKHSKDGREMVFNSGLPDDLKEILEKYEKI
jgi:23S rRNA pseudouridine1911/1915/1917 synthase